MGSEKERHIAALTARDSGREAVEAFYLKECLGLAEAYRSMMALIDVLYSQDGPVYDVEGKTIILYSSDYNLFRAIAEDLEATLTRKMVGDHSDEMQFRIPLRGGCEVLSMVFRAKDPAQMELPL